MVQFKSSQVQFFRFLSQIKTVLLLLITSYVYIWYTIPKYATTESYETPLAFYHSNEMNTQEDFSGFMILEEDITEEDEILLQIDNLFIL